MARKSQPFSLRLSKGIDRLVTAEAKRTKRSRSYVIEELAVEGLKARLVRGIAFRGDDYDRRAWLIGTGLDVWQVIEAYQDFDLDFDRMIGETDLSEAQLRTALDYYRRFPGEIDHFIALDRQPLENLREQYPHADVIVVSVE